VKSGWVETVWQDVRYGARLLRVNPGFAAVAILSLALGIGANTAIFQLLDAVRMRALPVKDPQQLAFVRIHERHGGSGRFHGYYSWLTNPQWEQIRDQQKSFSSVAAFGADTFNLARGGEVHNGFTLMVSGDFFQTLGVNPLMGRVLNAADDQKGCSLPAAVISYAMWQREYGGAADVLQKKLTLEGAPFQIVGVTPPDFYGIDVGRYYDVAVPICSEPLINGEGSLINDPHTRRNWWLGVVGRLKPGVTVEQASAQMGALSSSVFEATTPPEFKPDTRKKYMEYKLETISGANGVSDLRREYEDPLLILLGITGLVLLIACANLANLILARASVREREIAVRLAVGAGRFRLVRQLMAENLLLAVIGAAAGALIAQGVSRVLLSFLSTEGRQVHVDLALDWRVLGFTAAVAALTCLLFGLAPALRSTRMAPSAVMNATGRGLTATREGFGLRRSLVVAQIALSLVLAAGAILFARSLHNLITVAPGFQQDGVLAVYVDFSKLKIAPEQRIEYKRQLLERVRGLREVQAAAQVEVPPISGFGWAQDIIIKGEDKGNSLLNRISPSYFRTMGTSFQAGRDFNQQDTPTSPKVAIVNQTFAKKFLGGDPIGKTFHLGMNAGEPDPEYEVVGLVGDSKYYDIQSPFQPIAYFPSAQDTRPAESEALMVRAAGSMDGLLPGLRQTFREASPAISIEFHLLRTQISDGMLRERLMASLSGIFGGLAAVLAVIGMYGVMAYMVARRTGEIGVRMALGATPGKIVGMVVKEAWLLLAIGAVIGVGLTIAATRAAQSLLFGLKGYDPGSLAMAALALVGVTILASYIPARRAAAIEPMRALRDE
jgi:putative ABC transport system permease protein